MRIRFRSQLTSASLRRRTIPLTVVLAVLAAFATSAGACGEQAAKRVPPPAPAPPAAAIEKAAPPGAALSGESQAALVGVLDAYEKIRAELADDAIAPVAQDAASLETAASGAANSTDPTIATMLGAIAEAATNLKASSASDADGVRRAFGEVSRGVVALLGAVPPLREGRYMFECPMAQGYKRWVQPSDHMANPYMGKAMLECGAARSW